jgi:hypothetical protein
MAQFTRYSSSDASAPTLSGTVNDLVNVLDKVLVAGYGSQTAAGWTKPYTSTNAAVFRPGAGTRFYLQVNDNGPGAGTAKEARIVGYETMTAYATGSFLFPTAAQMANGLFVRKSVTADATTRNWIIYADSRTFYMLIETLDGVGVYYAWGFGDFYTLAAGDVWNCFINGRTTENSASTTAGESLNKVMNSTSSLGVSQLGFYAARAYHGGGTAVNLAKNGDNANLDSSLTSTQGEGAGSSGGYQFPNGPDNSLYLSYLYVAEPTTRRGWMRGLWQLCHISSSVPYNYVFAGVDDIDGRDFIMVKLDANGSGTFTFETSDTLDTNA